MWIAASIALISGVFSSGTSGLFLLLTRSYRKARNPFVIGLGYVLVGGAALGGLLLVTRTCDRMGYILHSRERNVAVDTFVIAYGIGVALAGWREIRWRKSVGITNDSH